MGTTNLVKKEFKIYSVEASNSGTPDSFHLVSVPHPEKFKTYEEAQKWIENEGVNADYTILEIFTKK